MVHGELCAGTRGNDTEGCMLAGYCVGGRVGRHVGGKVGLELTSGGPVGGLVGGKVGLTFTLYERCVTLANIIANNLHEP